MYLSKGYGILRCWNVVLVILVYSALFSLIVLMPIVIASAN